MRHDGATIIVHIVLLHGSRPARTPRGTPAVPSASQQQVEHLCYP